MSTTKEENPSLGTMIGPAFIVARSIKEYGKKLRLPTCICNPSSVHEGHDTDCEHGKVYEAWSKIV